MSAPTSLHQQPSQYQLRATSGGRPQQERMAANKQSDLIETKFNQLARKILAELQPNSARAQQFFLALDNILQEPHAPAGLQKSASGLSRSGSKKQLAEQQQELTRKCDILLAKQARQQDQIDSHQQILFDKQYESLPSEITGAARPASKSKTPAGAGQRTARGGIRKTATTSKLAERKFELEASDKGAVGGEKWANQSGAQRQRSAIPTSTILAGINQLSKSATTGSFRGAANPASQAGEQASLRGQSRPQQAPASQWADTSRRQSAAASAHLNQCRPAKPAMAQHQTQLSVDSDDEDDDDDDDDEDSYEYQNLASRRAHLNQRFVQPAAAPVASQPVAKSKTFSELKSSEAGNRLAPLQQQQAQQQLQRQQQVRNLVRSQAGAAGTQARRPDSEAEEEEHFEEGCEEPRSINGLLTSQSGSMMYKPHMNYSQSLLGNHRLSDDDEIIIIPTAQSPTPSLLMSASPSPSGARPSQLKGVEQEAGGNLDEFSERFSISRTKSFWEKLAGSKKIAGDESAASQSRQHSDANNNKLIQQHHSSAPNKSAFDRLDSTGGSGNSYHSGCSSTSSTSGDEQAVRNLSPALASQKQAVASARSGPRQQQQRGTWTAPNPMVKQLVQQEQLQRSDRFRQTR